MRRVAGTDVALLVMACVVVLVALSAVTLRPVSVEQRAERLAAELRCPTCAGLSIGDSPAPMAAQMRAVVAERIAAGDSDQDVRAFFVARYGRWILLDPPTTGIDVALWLVPVLVLAGGAGLFVWRARRRALAAQIVSTPPSRPGSRLVGGLTAAFMLAAIAVPVALAVGPRLAGTEITGTAAGGRTDQIRTLEERAAARPADPAVLVDLGDALLLAGRASEAADRYRAALDLDRDNHRALLGVGAILLDADRPDAAAAAFDRVLTLVPDQPDALVMRALGHLRLDGHVSERVRRDLERFLNVAPDDQRRAMVQSLLDEGGSRPGPSGP